MAFHRFNDDMNIISALSDEPNDTDGLSAAELKARFDEAGLRLQNFINSLIGELEAAGAAGSIGGGRVGAVEYHTVAEAMNGLHNELLGIQAGTVSDVSITAAKLAPGAVANSGLIGVGAVKGENIGSGAVGTEQIADWAVRGNKLNNYSVTAVKIAAGAVTADKLAADARALFYRAEEDVPAGKVKTDSIADRAVSGAKLDLAKGDLGTVKLVKGVHYFDTVEEAPVEAGRLVFVKADE